MGIATAVLQTFFILSMSYVLSRLRFKGRKGLMNFMLILGMFPGFLTLILIYKVFSELGLTNEMAPVGLIIVYCASSGMGYYVSKGFFDTIPKSLDEAARVDGATRWQVFYKVIMPLSKPIIIYTVLMGFMAPWGDFMMANYIAHQTSDGMNVAVGMFEWLSRTNLNTHYTMFCAAGVIVAIPVVTVFLLLQKYYVEGVTGGAVKG
jgi:arabinogalactan oligomer/maltooligosaccharide transport system permease protein